MSSSVERKRRARRNLLIAGLVILAAIGGFYLLPRELQASLREIGFYALVGIPLLVLALIRALPYSVFPGHGDDAERRHRPANEDMTAGWPPKKGPE